MSPFMLFAKDKRAGVVADNPGMPFGQVGKTIGEMWRELEDSDRAPYQAQAEAKGYRRHRRPVERGGVVSGTSGSGAEAAIVPAQQDEASEEFVFVEPERATAVDLEVVQVKL